MRVLIAPDGFGTTLSPTRAAAALAAGWRSQRPGDQLSVVGLADGGPGFLEVLAAARPAHRWRRVATSDLRGRPARARLLELGPPPLLEAPRVVAVESADVVGLQRLPAAARDPLRSSSAGLAVVLVEAARLLTAQGGGLLLVGLGGTATVDAGAEMLQRLLGAGEASPVGTADVELVAAVDTRAPLLGSTGAARVFGPQKFPPTAPPSAAQLERLEQRLAATAARWDPERRWTAAGSGAAGGLGFALQVLGGRLVTGFDVVAEACGLVALLTAADLVITGEGRLDATSWTGKVVGQLAGLAAARGVPCGVVAGQVRADAAPGGPDRVPLAGLWSAAAVAGSPARARREPARWVAAAAAAAAREFGAPG